MVVGRGGGMREKTMKIPTRLAVQALRLIAIFLSSWRGWTIVSGLRHAEASLAETGCFGLLGVGGEKGAKRLGQGVAWAMIPAPINIMNQSSPWSRKSGLGFACMSPTWRAVPSINTNQYPPLPRSIDRCLGGLEHRWRQKSRRKKMKMKTTSPLSLVTLAL